MPSPSIAVTITNDVLITQGEQLSKKLGIPFVKTRDNTFPLLLQLTTEHLELISTSENFSPLYVDFTKGKLRHRLLYGGGKNQLIAKAFGLHRGAKPVVLDLTAGLGQDAFVLASLGCKVTMLERSPIIAALLEDGLQRALTTSWFKAFHLELLIQEAKDFLEKINPDQKPEIIYLDPMFTCRKQSALVKKEMRLLRQVVGQDNDANTLLNLALSSAKKRIIVKRSRIARPLSDLTPDFCYQGKRNRFDVYHAKQAGVLHRSA